MRLAGDDVGADGAEVELNVGRLGVGQGASKQTAELDADGQRPAPREQPLHADARTSPQGAQIVIGRDALAAFVDQPHLQVVLKVLADAGRFGHQRDSVLAQQVGRADAGELKQLRGLDGTGRKHKLAPYCDCDVDAFAAIRQADRARAFE